MRICVVWMTSGVTSTMTVAGDRLAGLLKAEPVGSAPLPATEGVRDDSAVLVRRAWLVNLLVFVVMVAYQPVLQNDFVNWDDYDNFRFNYDYRGLTLGTLRWAWTTYLCGVYQPVSWMILSAEHALWGMAPRGYHFASLVLHTLNAVVLYYMSLALLRRVWPESAGRDALAARIGSALAAMAFAVHPLRVEVVAWASSQPYLPCALFCMLTVLAYVRASEAIGGRRTAWLGVACLLFGLALLSKAAAVGLAAVLLVLDVYPLRRLPDNPRRWFESESRRVLWEKVPFIAITAAFMVVAVQAKQQVKTVAPFHLDGPECSSRLAQAGYGTWFYLAKTVCPWGFSPFYPLPDKIGLTEWPFALCVAATAGAGVVLFRLRRRWPGLLAAFASYFIILSPNLGFIRIGNQIAADRYSYIASIGFVVLLAYYLGRLIRTGQPPLRIASVVVTMSAIILGLIGLTWLQCRVWRTDWSLWSQAYNLGVHRAQEVNVGLATAFIQQGRFGEAARHLEEAIRVHHHGASILPGSASSQDMLGSSLYTYGSVLSQQYELKKARSAFRHAIIHQTLACQLRPHIPFYRLRLAVQLHRLSEVQNELGQTDEAMESLNHSLDLLEQLAPEIPKNPQPNLLLALIHHEIGHQLEKEDRVAEALRSYHKARGILENLILTDPDLKGVNQQLEELDTEMRALQSPSAKPPDQRKQVVKDP